MTDFWTDERVSELERLYGAGLSCSQISARMGAASRNAIIGKLHRLGISGTRIVAKPKGPTLGKRPPAQGVGAAVQKINAAKAAPRIKPEPFVCAPVVDLDPLHLTLADLKEGNCRFPFGDDPAAMTFCGHQSLIGRSWCAKHFAVVTVPTPARRQSTAFIARGAAA